MKVWINGQYLSLAEAKVGFFDGGFQHAIGLFETMLARDGRKWMHDEARHMLES